MIQKAQRTVDVPLLQYIDTTVDVPVYRKQHEDCMTKYNEIKMDKKLRATCVSEFATRRGAASYVACNIDYTSEDGCSQTKLTCIDVLMPLSILEDTVAVMKLPHMSTHKQAVAQIGRVR